MLGFKKDLYDYYFRYIMAENNKIFSLLAEHTQWRTKECINLIPSENAASPQVLKLLGSDLSNRYTLNMNTKIHNVFIKNAYGGTKFTDAIETETEEVCKSVFNAKYCTVKPLSGHIAGLVMLLAVCSPKDWILIIHADHGGYDGYMPDYMPKFLNLEVDYLPFLETEWNVDSEAAAKKIREGKPRLVILGASFILYPYDIKPMREACDEVDAILGYDGSHVLGLIGGGEFQKPLLEGVDIVTGSTHKTLFGPQGGLIITNREDLFKNVSSKLTWYTIDNAHQNRIAALGQALLEIKEFGGAYAKQVISNSKALAAALDDSGIHVKFKNKNYTESHQVLLNIDQIESEYNINSMELSNRLEAENIIIDAVGRLGTNEMTRRGCKEEDMVTIAQFVKRVVVDKEKMVKNDIINFLKKFDLEYCFK